MKTSFYFVNPFGPKSDTFEKNFFIHTYRKHLPYRLHQNRFIVAPGNRTL